MSFGGESQLPWATPTVPDFDRRWNAHPSGTNLRWHILHALTVGPAGVAQYIVHHISHQCHRWPSERLPHLAPPTFLLLLARNISNACVRRAQVAPYPTQVAGSRLNLFITFPLRPLFWSSILMHTSRGSMLALRAQMRTSLVHAACAASPVWNLLLTLRP